MEYTDMFLYINPVPNWRNCPPRAASLAPWLTRGQSRASAVPLLSGLLLALALCSTALAQVGETRSRTSVWNTYAANPQGFAFDNVLPGTLGPNGCLSAAGVVTLPLEGGSVQVSLSSGACPIRDESAGLAISDAYVDNGTTLTFSFDPPINAFYTTYGSVAVGRAMRMRVKSGDGRVDHQMAGLTSSNATLATGHGFNSRVPIQTIEFTSTEVGTSVVGNFVGLAPGQESLGNCPPAETGASIPCDFLYAYDTTLPEGMLLLPDDELVRDVDISGDTAVVASTGVVNIFERNAGGPGNWGLVRKLLPPAAVDSPEGFAASVAIDGDWLVVGSPFATELPLGYIGQAYVYRRDAGGANVWGATHTLGPTLFFQENFGRSVGIDGATIVVGDPTHVTDAAEGFVDIFERSGAVWTRKYTGIRQYVDPIPTGFGTTVDVSGDTVVVGEPRVGMDVGEIGGLVHVYTRSPGTQGTWTAEQPLASVMSAITEYQLFGASVAVLADQPGIDDLVAVGMPQNPGMTPDGAPFAGAALGFKRASGGWSPLNEVERLYRRSPHVENAYLGVGVAIAGGHVYVSAPRSTFNPSTPPRRVYRYPYEAQTGSPVGVEVLRPDGTPLEDVRGPIAADGTDLLVAGRESTAWIINFDAVFADSFEP